MINRDEIENFRETSSDSFAYPFQSRNTIIDSFDIYDSVSTYDSNGDYKYL